MSRKKRKHRTGDDVEGTERTAAGDGQADAEPSSAEEPHLGAEPSAAEPVSEIERLRQQASEMRNLAQRKQAEFENYRKRMDRERTDLARYAGAETVKEVLPVLDNLERAVRAGGSSSEEQFRAGVEIIQRQLQEILLRLGLSEVESQGKPFDPHVHEAVSRIETEDEPDGTVLDVFQKGYLFKDRLLRPAMVSVARAPASSEPSEREGG
ncbi:MAG: nucleotide exchange factor GrpE, partial [Vicinamibacteria bacterium]